MSPSRSRSPRRSPSPPRAQSRPRVRRRLRSISILTGSAPDKIVRAGKETPVASVLDRALPTLAPALSARVEHGGVAIRTGNAPRCGKPSMSVTETPPRPPPGFHGTDTLHILGFLTSGDIDQTYSILVK